MRSSYLEKKEFGVYGFGEEDEAVEKASTSAVLKFRKRKLSPNAPGEVGQTVDFLEDFGGSKSLSHSGGPFELNSSSLDHTPMEGMFLSSGSDYSKKIQGKDPGIAIYDYIAEDLSEMRDSVTVEHSVFLPELASNTKEKESSSDESGSQTISTSSHHSSDDDGENEGSLDPVNLSDLACAKNMDIDAAVIVTPDFVVYNNELYAECHLIFSDNSITIECLDAGRGDGPLKFEWAIADLLFIGCCWKVIIETAYIEVRIKQADLSLTTQASGYDFSGTLSLLLAVQGSQWLGKEQKIWSLTPKYKELWKAEIDVSGKKLSCDVGKSISFYPRQQLNHFEATLEDVVYPQGDPDAVSISRRDIELLRPETFINDTIIDFYIKYLLDKIPSERSRFHFFNSFFFRKLADLDKDPKSVVGGRAAFLRVRKWTRKVNIFEKEYVFIPVNFNLHWSLLVICNPGEINGFKDEDAYNSLRVPCILHMDSIRGSHGGLKGLIQSYLWEEWKERHPECAEDDSTNFLNLRFVPLELPQQENYFDCGLFLLHYAELFLKEAPMNFNPFKITRFSNFLSADWFTPAEASFKRFRLRNLLYELLGNTNRIVPSHPSTGDRLNPDDVNKKDLVEVHPQNNMIPGSSLGDQDVNAESKRGLELFNSSLHVPMHSHDDQLKQPFLELKATGVDGHEANFTLEPVMPLGSTSKCMMPTILEDEDFVQEEAWPAALQTLIGTRGERCPTSILSVESDEEKVLGSSAEVIVQLEEQDDDNASSSVMSNLRSGWESEQCISTSDTNDDDSLPSQSSQTICSLSVEKIGPISSDDRDQDVSAGGTLEDHCIKGGLIIDPSGHVALNCKEDEEEHQDSIQSEIPENCTVEDSECDDAKDAGSSSADEAENAIPSLPKECEVIPDSPERKLIPNDDKGTPEAMAAICLSSDTSADAGDSVKFVCEVRDGENLETAHDACEQLHPKKRQRTQNPRFERKQTRSSSRTLSFSLP